MSKLAAIMNELPAPAAGTTHANPASWLKELESAQWQQRLRYQSTGGQQYRSGGSSDQPRADAPARQAASAHSPDDHARAGNAAARPESTPGNHTRQAVVTPAAARSTAPRPVIAAVPQAQQRTHALAGELPNTLSQPPSRGVHTAWQAQNMHAMLDADGVRVWLRDARYQGGDGGKLLRALRSHFVRLGLRLTQFTLNGTPVQESDPFQ